jgi:hypothetical protein
MRAKAAFYAIGRVQGVTDIVRLSATTGVVVYGAREAISAFFSFSNRVRRGLWMAFNYFQPQLEGLDFSLQLVDLGVETFHAYSARRFSAI